MKKKGRKKSRSSRVAQTHGKLVRRIRWRNIPKQTKEEDIIMMAGEPEAERERVEHAPVPHVP